MTDDSPVSRRRVLRTVGIGTAVALAGCSSSGNGSDGGDSSSAESTSTNQTDADSSPEEVVRKLLQALADGDQETARNLTVDEFVVNQGSGTSLTIESIEQLSAEDYAQRAGVSTSSVEDVLMDAEERFEATEATIVSYTASTEQEGTIQRNVILVLKGNQWLVFDFGQLPQ